MVKKRVATVTTAQKSDADSLHWTFLFKTKLLQLDDLVGS
jgi:hypothetical protein